MLWQSFLLVYYVPMYLYFVFGVGLEAGNIVGGHLGVTSVEPQRLAVVLVNSLLTQQAIN